MTIRLTLIVAAAHGGEVRFDDDAPVGGPGLRQAKAAARNPSPPGRYYVAPSMRCRQTAAALGLSPIVEPDLRDCDMGEWRGHPLTHVAAAFPDQLRIWMTDPHSAPHGGESVSDLCRRVTGWLDRLPADSGRVVAVAEPAVVRAGMLHALTAPPEVFWRIDTPPLAAVELTAHRNRWYLRLTSPSAP